MQDIIKIETSSISGTAVQTVNARELHAFLAVGKDFSTWVKLRISQYEFVENQDYVVADPAPQIWGAGNRGVKTEYHITLDMAKELSMVERNEKGKQARRYFIACEKQLKEALRQQRKAGSRRLCHINSSHLSCPASKIR